MAEHATIGYREVLALVFEVLQDKPSGQYMNLAQDVLELAARKSLVPSNTQPGRPATHRVPQQDQRRITELVREAMWECLIKRIIVFGSDNANPAWPFFRVTERGAKVLASESPQPYDPDGFLEHFRQRVSPVDPVIDGYVAEAVNAFNAGCTRSAAVMLGCASEKLLLVLVEAFGDAINDDTEREKYEKKLAKKWTVSHKYGVLREYLDRVNNLPHEHRETVKVDLQSGFELFRRCRNSAGHPDVPGDVASDTVFLNLRVFTEYARKTTALVEHLGSNPVTW